MVALRFICSMQGRRVVVARGAGGARGGESRFQINRHMYVSHTTCVYMSGSHDRGRVSVERGGESVVRVGLVLVIRGG